MEFEELLPQKVIERLKECLRKRNVPEWEIYFSRKNIFELEAKRARIESLRRTSIGELSVRVIIKKRMGYGYSHNISEDGLERVVERAVASADLMPKDEHLGFPEPSQEPNNLQPQLFDEDYLKIPEEEKANRVLLLEASAMEYDRRIKTVRKASSRDVVEEIFIENSNGLQKMASVTLFSLYIMAVASENGDTQTADEFISNHFYAKLSPEQVARSASENAVKLLGAKVLPSRRAKVLLKRNVGAEFLKLLAEAFSAEAVDKNRSWLKGREGKKIFSDVLTFVDDGLEERGLNSLAFDGEGVSSKRTVLVRDGILENFIYDSYYARRRKKESTGNCVRRVLYLPPCIGARNFHILGTGRTTEEILRAMADGFIVEDVLGMHTSNAVTGEFSVGVCGHRVRNGELEEPFSGMAISGSLLGLFERVVDVGSDLRFYECTGSGGILIDGMELSGD